jgi:hypothetical protein
VNRNRLATILFALTLALFGTACPNGGGSGSGGGGGDPTVMAERDVDQVLQAMADGYCDGIWSCFETHPTALVEGYELGYEGIATVEQCKAVIKEEMSSMRTNLVQAVIEGRAQINRSAISACGQGIYDAVCSDAFELVMPSACHDAIRGHQAVGEPCVDDFECADRGDCRRTSDCYGECTPFEDRLRSCGGVTCELGEYCTVFDGEAVCHGILDEPCHTNSDCELGSCGPDNRCDGDIFEFALIRSEGESCAETATTVGVCSLGLYCDWYGTSEVCQPHRMEGDACESTYQCSHDLRCTDGECQRTVATLELGELCDFSYQCLSGRCGYDEEAFEFVCVEPVVCVIPDDGDIDENPGEEP